MGIPSSRKRTRRGNRGRHPGPRDRIRDTAETREGAVGTPSPPPPRLPAQAMTTAMANAPVRIHAASGRETLTDESGPGEARRIRAGGEPAAAMAPSQRDRAQRPRGGMRGGAHAPERRTDRRPGPDSSIRETRRETRAEPDCPPECPAQPMPHRPAEKIAWIRERRTRDTAWITESLRRTHATRLTDPSNRPHPHRTPKRTPRRTPCEMCGKKPMRTFHPSQRQNVP